MEPFETAGYRPPVLYQHPLAYLLGLEGVALLRAWAGDYDREFVEARLAEVRRLLDDEALVKHSGVVVGRGDTATGYRSWAATYDEPRNSLFDSDEPVMHDILDALPAGTVLDAACGTGRYAAYLVARGHRVVGVDSSPEMLDRARARVPDATFLRGDLHRLPLTDGAVDVAVQRADTGVGHLTGDSAGAPAALRARWQGCVAANGAEANGPGRLDLRL